MTDTMATTPAEKDDSKPIREKAVAAKMAVSDLAGEVKSYASDRLSKAKSHAGETLRGANDSVVSFVQKNPYQSLAIAAGAGLVLGMLLKRR